MEGTLESSSVQPVPIHYVTVGADAGELARFEKFVELLKPLSSKSVESLDELTGAEYPQDAFTILRLFGRANTQALTWLSSKGRVATEVAILGVADGILIEPGQPPRAIGVLPQAFISALAERKISFDLSSAAFIVGVSDETKVIAACLSRLGFKRLKFVDSEDRKTEQLVQYLRRRLLGIELEVVPRRALTQVPNESAFAVSLVASHDKPMLEDISYLNFLKKNGIWIDWNGATVELGLENEIVEAGAAIFDPNIIRAWREALLLEATGKVLSKTGQKPDILAIELSRVWQSPRKGTKTDPS